MSVLSNDLPQKTYLKHDNEEEQAHRDVNLKPRHHHATAAQLAQQVDEHEDGGQELAASPAHVHVLALFVPLEVHAKAILEEGGDEAEACHSRQHILSPLDNLQNSGEVASTVKFSAFVMEGR